MKGIEYLIIFSALPRLAMDSNGRLLSPLFKIEKTNYVISARGWKSIEYSTNVNIIWIFPYLDTNRMNMKYGSYICSIRLNSNIRITCKWLQNNDILFRT